jgi:Cell division protein FtsI/penicillin-binding protein 2
MPIRERSRARGGRRRSRHTCWGLRVHDVYRALTRPGTHFSYVYRKAPTGKASVLARKKLAGLHFYAEERRTYPQNSVAAQVLGYAGVDNTGLAGLESELNGQLTGSPGEQTIVRDPFGRAISIAHTTPARPGKAVFLTLDHRIQADAEQVLRQTVARYGAKDGRRSCSIRIPAPCSRWPRPRATTRTTSRRPSGRACSATTRSRTCSSRGRCSRS